MARGQKRRVGNVVDSENTVGGTKNLHIVRSVTFVIAANDSSQDSKDMADYVCDGTDDYSEIQDALDAMSAGDYLKILPGTYVFGTTGITHDLTGTIDFRGATLQYEGTGSAFNWGHATGKIYNAKLLGGTIEGTASPSESTACGLSIIGQMWGDFDCHIKNFFTGTGIKLNTDSGNSQWSESNLFKFRVEQCKTGWSFIGDELTSYNTVLAYEWEPGDASNAIGIDATYASGISLVCWKFDKVNFWPYGTNNQTGFAGSHMKDCYVDNLFVDDTSQTNDKWITFSGCTCDVNQPLIVENVVMYGAHNDACLFTDSTGNPPYVKNYSRNAGVQWRNNFTKILQTEPTVDHTCTGAYFWAYAGEGLSYGDTCYFNSDSMWYKTCADDEDKSKGFISMAGADISVSGYGIFIQPRSFVRDDSWSFTPSSGLFLSTTSGCLTMEEPSDDVIRRVGYAYKENVVYFDPDFWSEAA